jgi:hypothetical protein
MSDKPSKSEKQIHSDAAMAEKVSTRQQTQQRMWFRIWSRALYRFLPALASAITLVIIGGLGMLAGLPWLFPSLGPSIVIQTTMPDLSIARPWNVIVGHMIGMCSGLIALYATGAIALPSVASAQMLSAPRVLAAALAVLLSMVLQSILKAQHAPAEATTLLIALGALPATPRSALVILIGVLLVTVIGEAAKKITKPQKG